MRVANAWAVPGLGLLALPSGPAPGLQPYALHTALAVMAILPDGTRHAATATVEEISRPMAAEAPVRGLLLDFGTTVALLSETEIWLTDAGQ